MRLTSALLAAALLGPASGVHAIIPGDPRNENPTLVTVVHGSDIERKERLAPLLERRQATVNERLDAGLTLPMWAADSGRAGSTHLLLERGADTAMRGELGQDAADLVRAAGHPVIAAQLRGQC